MVRDGYEFCVAVASFVLSFRSSFDAARACHRVWVIIRHAECDIAIAQDIDTVFIPS